jgi:hypothetical protein
MPLLQCGYPAETVSDPVASNCSASGDVGLPLMINFAVPGGTLARSVALTCTVRIPLELPVTVPNVLSEPYGTGVGGTILHTRPVQADKSCGLPDGCALTALERNDCALPCVMEILQVAGVIAVNAISDTPLFY